MQRNTAIQRLVSSSIPEHTVWLHMQRELLLDLSLLGYSQAPFSHLFCFLCSCLHPRLSPIHARVSMAY